MVLHYTGMPTAAAALARLRDPVAKVSAHWLVNEDGTVIALVPEALRAWHAGVSAWQNRIGLNDTSIGVEIVNPGHEWGYRPFPRVQIEAVICLCQGIMRRWRVPPERVLGHSDIAPHRKQDPGELFPWRLLAEAGIGMWPSPTARPAADPEGALRVIGYPLDLPGVTALQAVRAFQRRYRPERIDGIVDKVTSRLISSLECLQVGGCP